MRLFVGIALTSEVQEGLESWLSALRNTFPKLRWSEPKQWHVTVQFLGQTEEARYACVVEQLRGLRAHPVSIQIDQPGFFERAGIFHVSVLTAASLIELHDQAEAALATCGFEPELRPYSPHITLARRKGRGFSHDFEQLKKSVQKLPPMRLPSIQAKEFLLYQSFTDPSGSRYEVRERFPLM
ncbi:RNA 2',3'-cyclic phosphodiesterase [Alloacidobacterium dinghuense]|uniref:RNA 2',3'-cyclic phosphodiesterase n=1 Tax=Alloacidobacterium dinghuense TaxID=2763107 RepID=A0A7G8BI87_9BACT|nr:RNA 2',3'-cyclic phosphodiesterase [Alloacidobacterium dinghuense]QNI32257.1 RNA 2',3'-cyclic phosphodiesterase [Alloacidobacterium dinghuense]